MRRGPLDNVDVWAVKRAAEEEGVDAGKDNVAAQLRADVKHEEAQLEAERQELGVGSPEDLVVLVEEPPSHGRRGPAGTRAGTGAAGAEDGPGAAAAKRARRDAPAALRVARLRAAGHWSDDLPPAQSEPTPPKTHWGYLLDEAVWLAREVHGERAWKQKAARQTAQAARKGLEELARLRGGRLGAVLAREGDQEAALRRIARATAAMVRGWWKKLQLVAQERQAVLIEEERRKTVAQRLELVVDQTQQLSQAVAASFAPSTPPPEREEDAEFAAGGDEDELATLLEAEGQEEEGEVAREVDALQQEAEMDIEALLAQYGGYRLEGSEEEDLEEEEQEEEEEREEAEEKVAVKAEPRPAAAEPPVKRQKGEAATAAAEGDYKEEADEDELATLLEAEGQEEEGEVAKEVDALQQEAEMDIEALLAQYGGYRRGVASEDEQEEGDEEEEEEEEEEEGGADEEDNEDASDEQLAEECLKEGEVLPFGTAEMLAAEGDEEAGRAVMESAAREAASAQPTGWTLATSAVRTPLPSRLRGPGPLREYQHIGLDWLVALYDKGLNGILADEMASGLGKTIQTIALLAHLAEARGIWGPHLIVVPTSVLLNWEKECKTWYPSFKVLAYYGSAKARAALRVGWGRPNAFHVCVTTYNVVLQDASAFRRRQWQYLILDEAHNIRNFRSKRWQVLLGLKARRRLLLTGTPLQNSLMELWSLLHFLMPHVFASHSEFKWFSSPLDAMIEGKQVDAGLVERLHTVLRPFLLRRLKRDVERQLPDKFEHVQLCRLSKRQRGLYEEFLASRRDTLRGGNVLGVMNVLMQLRKVCNHPELFEERPIVSPLDCALPVPRLPALCALPPAAPLPCAHASLFDCELGRLEPARAVALAVEARRALLHPPPAPPRLPTPPATAGSPEALLQAVLRAREADSEARLAAAARRGLLRAVWERPLLGAALVAAVTLPGGGGGGGWRGVAAGLAEAAALAPALAARAAAATFVIPRARALARETVTLGALAPDWDAGKRAVVVRQQLYFPDKRLLQYDCGKLQVLAGLLTTLRAGGHRVLIFTQMTRMLDILETFLAFHHHPYLRLDGATRTDRRYEMMERFNEDPRIFCFILSTRSGGLGINLTGADTVIFFDSDWNPAMDAQAQDRAHRIGQTRTVHIYRLISERTVEENILKKALQKRQLEQLTLQEGAFSPAGLAALGAGARVDLRELIGAGEGAAMALDARAWAEATRAAEDGADAAAAEAAAREAAEAGDAAEFAEGAAAGAAAGGGGAAPLDGSIEAQLTPLERLGFRLVQAAAPDLLAHATAALAQDSLRWEQTFRQNSATALTYAAPGPSPPPPVYKPPM